ncbi:unnamed protein product, partial [Pylaiella littoralis]
QEDHIARSDVGRRFFKRWWTGRRHGQQPQHQLYTRPNGHDQGASRDCDSNSDRQCNGGRHSSSISGRASCGYLYSNTTTKPHINSASTTCFCTRTSPSPSGGQSHTRHRAYGGNLICGTGHRGAAANHCAAKNGDNAQPRVDG